MNDQTPTRTQDVEKSRIWIVWVFWPYIVFALAVPWFVLAGVLYDFGGEGEFLAPLRSIGAWVSPIFDDAVGLAGVIATVLVAAAATTGFAGDWSKVAVRARAPIQAALTLSIVILAAMCSAAVPAVIADASTLPRAALIFCCGWLISFVGISIFEVASPEQVAARALVRLTDKRTRLRQLVPPLGRRYNPKTVRGAELAAWGIPVSLWVVAAVGPAYLQFAGTIYVGLALGLTIGLLLMQLLVLVGWRATADRSIRPAARVLVRLALSLPAIGAVLPVAIELTGSSMAWLGWVALANLCALVMISDLEIVSRRFPWVRIVEDAATTLSMHRALLIYRAARGRAEEQARE